MPKEGIDYVDKSSLLRYEEMYRLIRLLHSVGVDKVRITGGEPFARKNLMVLLRNMASVQGLSWHMTTNAVLLAPHIDELSRLGIDSVNVSLDALDRQKFHDITRRDKFRDVYSNIMALLENDIRVKINCVVMNGRNEDQIVPLASLAEKYPVEVRFIEEMPFNGTGEKRPVINHRQIESVLREKYSDLTAGEDDGQTARCYTSADLKGSLGIIAAYTRTFCGTCDRLRISATGELRTCLYGKYQLDVLRLLRENLHDEEILHAIRQAVSRKEKDGFVAEEQHKKFPNTSMSILGG